MRVLLLCYEFPPLGGGGSRVCHGLAKALTHQGHQVHVITSGFPGLPTREVSDGVTVTRVTTLRRRVDRSNAFELAVYSLLLMSNLLRERPDRHVDICHVHFIFPDGLVAWAVSLITGWRYVLTAHGSDVPGYNPERFRLLHRVLRPVWHRVAHGAERLVCASTHLAALVRQADNRLQPVIIPNGLDRFRFHASPAPVNAVLCVCRLFARKGVHKLLQAAAHIGPGAVVHIVGDGPARATLEQQAANSRATVHFHGWLDNASPKLHELYRTLAIFVLPSMAENFPVVLLEAMSAGMAIITTSDTGCAYVVGEAALLVPSDDAEALARALHRLLSDPGLRHELGRQARQRFEQHFTWPVVARRHAELYHAVLGHAKAVEAVPARAPS